jgi:hypothetical protein
MGTEPLDIVGWEDDIGVDPHDLIEPVAKCIGGDLVACGIDGGLAEDASHGIAASFELAPGRIAVGLDVMSDGDEDGAVGGKSRVHSKGLASMGSV